MKTLLATIGLALASCTPMTTTTTHADGSKTTIEQADPAATAAALEALRIIAAERAAARVHADK